MKTHRYQTRLLWSAGDGPGTTAYTSYQRDHTISAAHCAPIDASSDPAFRGNPDRYNPEQLLVASLASCHMLWYLHLCTVAGVVVVRYEDSPSGEMVEDSAGFGQFERVTLRPRATVVASDRSDDALHLHHEAHERCFIARSVRFAVDVEPTTIVV